MKYICLFDLPLYGLEKGKIYSGKLDQCNMIKIYDKEFGIERYFNACLFQILE